MFIVSDWCGGGWLSISEPLLVSGQVLTPRYLSRHVVDIQYLVACKQLADKRMQSNPSKSQFVSFKGFVIMFILSRPEYCVHSTV
jgi:hypothetical protein